jgi:hypothetical protein
MLPNQSKPELRMSMWGPNDDGDDDMPDAAPTHCDNDVIGELVSHFPNALPIPDSEHGLHHDSGFN